MTLQLQKRELAIVGLAVAALLAVWLAGRALWGEAALVIVVLLGFALVLAAVGELYRRMVRFHEARSEDYRQVEALFSLFAMLDLNAPLPPMREWASSPDLVSAILARIKARKPELVLELGSGVSTLVAAYALRAQGTGRLIALEHDQQVAASTTRRLAEHQLSTVATVAHAPLEPADVHGRQQLWYNQEPLRDLGDIDLLIVDGPPGVDGELARYPALPLLMDRLSPDAEIIVDDGDRDEERRTVALWLEQFDGITAERLPTENGAFILRRSGAAG